MVNNLALPAVKLPRVPVSRNEYLDRRAKLWSLIQGIDPEIANMEEIAAEKAALDDYMRNEPSMSTARADTEGVAH